MARLIIDIFLPVILELVTIGDLFIASNFGEINESSSMSLFSAISRELFGDLSKKSPWGDMGKFSGIWERLATEFMNRIGSNWCIRGLYKLVRLSQHFLTFFAHKIHIQFTDNTASFFKKKFDYVHIINFIRKIIFIYHYKI